MSKVLAATANAGLACKLRHLRVPGSFYPSPPLITVQSFSLILNKLKPRCKQLSSCPPDEIVNVLVAISPPGWQGAAGNDLK